MKCFLLSIALLSVVWAFSGCGKPPEEEAVAQVTSALNGHSIVPPGGGWTAQTQPWLCDAPIMPTTPPRAWDPLIDPWPTHGHCQWMPSTISLIPTPWNVQRCVGDPTVPGTMDIYSKLSNVGLCARIAGLGGTTPFQWDSDLVQVNGWLAIYTDSSGTPKTLSIKSIKLAPYTSVILCGGPFTGPADMPCNAYPYWAINNGPNVTPYPSLEGLQVAAIQIKAVQ
jgi:hypothetical protein